MWSMVSATFAFTVPLSPPIAPQSPPISPLPMLRCTGAHALLTLGDDPDFDPFAADYPPAVVPAKKIRVKLSTTAGVCHVLLDRALAPKGVDRFVELVEAGFFTNQLLYRVLPGLLVQFGVAQDPTDHAEWEDAKLTDEPNRRTFQGGTVSFAGGGMNSRSCHVFVALSPGGACLGNAAHEATLGRVEEVEVFERVAEKYAAQGYPADLAVLQKDLIERGNEAALAYPRLDRIISAEVLKQCDEA